MAKDLTLDAWLVLWSEDGINITVPIASITGLTAAEADVTTGDIRQILLKLLSRIKTVYDGLPSADRPATLFITEAQSATGRKFTIEVTGAVTTFTPGTDV